VIPGRLDGRRILVTRPGRRGETLGARLGQLGADVEVHPTIAFLPPRNGDDAQRAIRELERYDWFLFTSATGVRYFGSAIEAAGARIPAGAKVAAIGSATARALRDAGIEPDLTAKDSRSEGLAAAFADQSVADTHMLLVRPEIARDVLPHALASAGARVTAVAFYRTVAGETAATAAERVCEGRYDVTLFSSPSTLRFLLQGAGPRVEETREALGRTTRVAIGAVTATALDEERLPAHAVALEPTERALVEAVIRACGT
jgi:uroporphyrinogen-III synthase